MKKIFVSCLAVLSGAVMLLSACGRESDVPVSSAGSQEESSFVSTSSFADPDSVAMDDSRIGILYEENGSYQIGDDSRPHPYSYRVPVIPGDTEGIRSINQDIDKLYGESVRKALDKIEKKEYPAHEEISWKSYWRGSILSILMEIDMPYQKLSHSVYHYDFAAGVRLDNRDFVARLGISEDDFLNELRRAALHLYDRNFSGYSERARTISADNLNLDNVMLFADREQISAIAMINEPVSAIGFYEGFLDLDLSPAADAEQRAELGAVRALLKKGRVFLSFSKKGASEGILSDAAEFDRLYPVEGLYGKISSLFLGEIGEDGSPFLLTKGEDGLVSFCDVGMCGRAGNRFIAAPLTGMSDVVSFAGEAGDIYGVTGEGSKILLSDLIRTEQHGMLEKMDSLDSWLTADQSFCLRCEQDKGGGHMTLSDGAEFYDGWFFYTGMTEEGCLYCFTLEDQAGETFGGIMTVPYLYQEVSKEKQHGVKLEILSGNPSSSIPDDGILELIPGKWMDGTGQSARYEGSLMAEWGTFDSDFYYQHHPKITFTRNFLQLMPAKKAMFQIADQNEQELARYEGCWRQTAPDRIRLDLKLAAGAARRLDSRSQQKIRGEYEFFFGLENTLVLRCVEGAVPLFSMQQNMPGRFPAALYQSYAKFTYQDINNTDEMRRAKRAVHKYCSITGFPAHSAAFMGLEQDGYLFCMYSAGPECLLPAHWFTVDPYSLTGRDYATGEPIDFSVYDETPEHRELLDAALRFYNENEAEEPADFAQILGLDQSGLILEISRSSWGSSDILTWYVINPETWTGFRWEDKTPLDINSCRN